MIKRSKGEKFECFKCGCYFWVKDRNNFECPNCKQNKKDNDIELSNNKIKLIIAKEVLDAKNFLQLIKALEDAVCFVEKNWIEK